ncbi:MAG: CoA transferase [Dehalococcoidia bacterium]|nr:CoA transferase [Dehalococcoidia bacterium]MDP6228563.1 CoA transferase [Dehalococcoidia bacterium]MDP7084917.1 CoA transferase [Dehalococcoidia bacterium]MDP7199639.1 CoA transferase [Dehalococcoidia bacterium]MDP7509537.1 CoA transferase [Dehalococcoidia bacterium]
MPALPLHGIRVLDLSRVFAMPYAGAYLADLGAEVIKVDTHHSQFMESTRQATGPFPGNDPGELYFERGGTFQTLNRGKRSLTLDLRSESARAVVKELVAVCDVVLENFTPRVMARFELDYPNLRAHKPDLIMVSNTGYGHSGPWTNYGAMASALEPTHGTGAFMGYLEADAEGRRVAGHLPNKMGNSYTDFLATWTALGAVMACLLHRARTGRGMWVDLAMYQVGVSFVGEGLLDFAFNGRRTRRLGNRHQTMCPHGCYPCEGADSWVTLAVRDDADWSALCRVLDQSGIHLADDPRFSDPLTRRRHQDELDDIIAGWTSTQGQYPLMDRLQAVGVPAGPVLNARQLLADPQFHERGFFESVQHSRETGLGRREYIGRGWKLSENNLCIRGPAPRMGEANSYVLHEVLGRTESDISELHREGVTGESPVGGGPPSAVPLERQVELGWIVERDEGFLPR